MMGGQGGLRSIKIDTERIKLWRWNSRPILAHFQGVTERLQSLSDSFSQMSQRKEELLAQIQSCEQRMNRAQRLIGALGTYSEFFFLTCFSTFCLLKFECLARWKGDGLYP